MFSWAINLIARDARGECCWCRECSWLAKIHSSCTLALWLPFSASGRGAGWLRVGDRLISSSLLGCGTVRRIRTAPSRQPNKFQKKSPAVRRDQSRDCGLCGLHPALVPDAATVVGMGSPTEPCTRSQESTCLRAVLRWRNWVTPLKGEWAGKESDIGRRPT